MCNAALSACYVLLTPTKCVCTHAENAVSSADVTPIFFMWEKLVGTHYKPAYIRLPSRLPVGELQTLLSAPGCRTAAELERFWNSFFCMTPSKLVTGCKLALFMQSPSQRDTSAHCVLDQRVTACLQC